MSCYWDVLCVDCKESAGIPDANRMDFLMEMLIKHRAALEALAALDAESSLELFVEYKRVDPAWFAQHRGHQLKAVDEYGRAVGEGRVSDGP